jgi:hypothetical protein
VQVQMALQHAHPMADKITKINKVTRENNEYEI